MFLLLCENIGADMFFVSREMFCYLMKKAQIVSGRQVEVENPAEGICYINAKKWQSFFFIQMNKVCV